ncbi:hypothetical protein [Paramagnetospirillum magnetotacticum]|jgi:hypothetical protein|nr:hypothetical protein [Paramagnetospirillum magnetotacticum]
MGAAAHWESRIQQRGIPAEAIDLVMAYGESQHDHHGCEIIYLSARGKQRVLKDAANRNLRRLDKLLDVYVVVGRSGIATVGHRYKRIARP